MSGIDQINEGGDYLIENGIRRKVGYTTDELTQNPALLAVQEAAMATLSAIAETATDPVVADTTSGMLIDAPVDDAANTTTKKGR